MRPFCLNRLVADAGRQRARGRGEERREARRIDRRRSRGRARPLQRRGRARRAARGCAEEPSCSSSTSQRSRLSTRPRSAYSSRRARVSPTATLSASPRRARDPPRARGLRPRQALLRPRHRRRGACLMPTEGLLPPASLARYADAIVKASLVVGKGDTLVVMASRSIASSSPPSPLGVQGRSAIRRRRDLRPARLPRPAPARERRRARRALAVDRRLLREASSPDGALAAITGEGEAGYLDGVRRSGSRPTTSRAKQTAFVRRAQLNMESRWSIAAWPADYWASQVYPEPRGREARSGSSRRTSSTSAGSPTPTAPGRVAGRST